MSFNPFEEKGIPVEKQLQSWTDLNGKPYNKNEVHPYTRCRVILMNGAEFEGVWFGHHFARHTDDLELKKKLAMSRRIEQQQQKMISGLVPADENVLEQTIGYEQVAVDLTAFLAQVETNQYVKAALDFALLEDFDHLYRYANLMEMTMGKKAEVLTDEYTEITPGRPTVSEHRHPLDDVRSFTDFSNAAIQTKLNTMIIVAGEQQTMNFYMNVANRPDVTVGRGLYQEIAMIEEQHVTHYESLLDPRSSWLEMLVMHEYNECYLYYSLSQDEPDARIKKIWERHLEMEIEHLHVASALMKKYEKRDPKEMFPKQFPELFKFQSNVDYVREILASQVDYNAQGTEFVPGDQVPADSKYHEYQKAVNKGGTPSQQVIEDNIKKNGKDYRQELKGEHPVKRLRERKKVVK
jgi:rubrerythrin